MLNRNPKGHIDIGHFIDYNCGRYFIKNAVFNAGKQVTSVSYCSLVNTTIFSKKYYTVTVDKAGPRVNRETAEECANQYWASTNERRRRNAQ